MIAVDTSSLSNFLKGSNTKDAELVKKALIDDLLILPPVVIAELLSSQFITKALRSVILEIPVLELKPGFWERVGSNRNLLLKDGRKARLADAMIATCCLDHGISIISSDHDFQHFSDYFGLSVHP
jgi:predicted nucleic acid-binding protein